MMNPIAKLFDARGADLICEDCGEPLDDGNSGPHCDACSVDRFKEINEELWEDR